MAVETSSFWSRFFDLPRKNESYLPYVFSLKFVWAPLTYMFFSFIDSLQSLFVGKEKNDEGLGNIDTSHSTGNTPLYKHTDLITVLSSSTDMDNPNQMVQTFESNPYFNDLMGNTPLTDFLAKRVFSNSQEYRDVGHKEIMSVLNILCQLAQTTASAKWLLTAPNNPIGTINTQLVVSGMPVNTPLMLLVKSGDFDGVKMLLPFYSAEELMKTTPRGNSVFHIASITGQEEILNELKTTAVQLGIWNEYKEHKNIAGYSAFDMLTALSSSKDHFKNLLDFSDDYLGGEEINKVAVTDQGQKRIHMVRRGAMNFYRSLTKDSNSSEKDNDMPIHYTPRI